MPIIGWFKGLCIALDTPGGHMVFCLALIVVGATMCKIGLTEEGKAVVGGATGAALMAMRGLSGGSVNRELAPVEPPPSTPSTVMPPLGGNG